MNSEEKKESNIELINNILELSFKMLPFILGFFILLDINLFTNTFNFNVGLISLIFSNLNLANINLLFIVTFIPFLLSSFVILPIFLIKYFRILMRRKTKFWHFYINDKISTYILFGISVSCLFFLFAYFIEHAFSSYHDLFFVYLLIIILSLIFSLAMKIFPNNNYIPKIIGFLVLITIGLSMYGYKNELLLLSILISIFIIIFNLLDIQGFNKFKLKTHRNLSLKIISIIIIVLTGSYIYFNNINSNSWRNIEEGKTGISYLTFNLIFNKGLLLKNNSTINIDFEKKYYEKESAILSFKNNNNFEIDNNYLYLQLTNNIKLFVKNLKHENKTVFLLVEEKITHEAISKYSLIDISIINKNKME